MPREQRDQLKRRPASAPRRRTRPAHRLAPVAQTSDAAPRTPRLS
jgi:hypothetical protein